MRFYAVILAFFVLLGALSTAAYGESADNADGLALLEEIISYNTEGSLQEWADGELSASPELNEWYAVSLSRLSPETDLSVYADALEKYLSENEIYSASTKQKLGIILIACGRANSEYLQGLVDRTAGKQGIMSYIFALHLLNNGAASTDFSAANLIPVLLTMACPDGGWSLTGQVADVDVTAMAIQSLAPYCGIYPEVKSAVDIALSILSDSQHEDGDFSTYGTANPESAAQVTLALRALGRDPLTETGFIKNGNNVLDGMTKYRLDSGGYSHTENGAANHAATMQVFFAVASLQYDGSPYLLTDTPTASAPLDYTLANSLGTPTGPNTGGNGNTAGNPPGGTAATPPSVGKVTNGYKLPLCIGIAVAAAVLCVFLALRGNRKRQNYIVIALGAVLLIIAVIFVNFTRPEDYYGTEITKEHPIGEVTVEIRCDLVAEHAGNAAILEKTSVQIEDGETVYDILVQIARKEGFTLDMAGNAVTGGMYVRAINSLGEFDRGDLSGWIYTVNGKRANIGCADYVLKDGDRIAWHYSLALGDDIEE